MRQHVLLVGCGHLGQALLRRWLAENGAFDFTVIKPSPLPADLAAHKRVAWHKAMPQTVPPLQAIIYAVRPVQLPEVLPHYKTLAQTCVNISVAAGWPMHKFAKFLGEAALIRTMPNVPAQIGQGITPMIANKTADQKARQLAETFFKLVGETLWLKDDAEMDIATAMSGSGPAYIYLLTAALAHGGSGLGLSEEAATRLARATVRGAANYMEHSGENADELYRAMMLPNSTTEAALTRLLADDGMMRIMREALQLATERAKKIAAA